VKTNAKDAGTEVIQDLRNALTRRLTDGLADDAITTLTVRQLREVVRQEVGAALADVAGGRPAAAQTTPDGGRASEDRAETQSRSRKLGPLVLIAIVIALGFAFFRSLINSAPSGFERWRPAGVAPAPARADLRLLDSIAADERIFRRGLDGVFDNPKLRSGNGMDM
jgi:hypothetical protein